MSRELTVGATKNSISRARSSIERILAFSLWFSLLAHGLFFAREVVAMGVVLALYEIWCGRVIWGKASIGFTETDLLLFGMTALSLSGLLNPVKAEEAWLEGIRCLICWFVYIWSREISGDSRSRRLLLKTLNWAALALVLSGFLPWVSKIWPSPLLPEAGRLSSWLGYPNATAAFLGAVLFLPGLNIWLRLVIFFSIVSTGSRSALILVFLLKGSELFLRNNHKNVLQLFLNYSKSFLLKLNPYPARGQKLRPTVILVPAGIAFLAGIGLINRFHPALDHLLVWETSKSFGERLLYIRDGLRLAWMGNLLPRAGGWLAFPLVQQIPYWTSDPHSGVLHILLNQGLPGIIGAGAWTCLWLKRAGNALKNSVQKDGENGWLGTFLSAVFLLLHSMIDADMSFAALGIFFWLIIGQLEGGLYPERTGSMWKTGLKWKRSWFSLVLSVFLLFAIGKALFPQNSLTGWNSISTQSSSNMTRVKQALAGDQSNIDWRKKLAELEFRQGDWEEGLREAEKVLAWAKFDAGAYEWAQSIVWEAAEAQRLQGNPAYPMLYNWVAQVPILIKKQAQSVPPSERYLWAGYSLFHSTPHIDLLAKQARAFTFYSP